MVILSFYLLLLLLVSEASPHWGVEWKTLYCCAYPYIYYIYLLCHILIYWRILRRFYGLDQKSLALQQSKNMAMPDLEIVVNEGENGCRFEDRGKKTAYTRNLRG